jgi:hypothetical protein
MTYAEVMVTRSYIGTRDFCRTFPLDGKEPALSEVEGLDRDDVSDAQTPSQRSYPVKGEEVKSAVQLLVCVSWPDRLERFAIQASGRAADTRLLRVSAR